MRGQWIGTVKATPLTDLLPLAGLRPGRLGSFGPCPACGEAHRGSDDKRGACGMAGDRRGWTCHRCHVKGDALDLLAWAQHKAPSGDLSPAQWADLREWCVQQSLTTEREASPAPRVRALDVLLGGSTRKAAQGHTRPTEATTGPRQGAGTPEPPDGLTAPTEVEGGRGPFAWREGLAEDCAVRLWEHPDGQAVLAYLRDERGFSEETVEAWGLGCIMVRGEPWLTIPLKDEAERVVNVRFRSVPPARKQYRVCPGRPLPLFGSHTLGNDLGGTVIITEGELDVVALWQYGATVSVVSGTAGAGAWKDEWLDQLEPYSGFTLCYDNDEAGEAGARAFAEKMGLDRCSRAVLPRKDAGECLRDGVPGESVFRVLDRAQPMFGIGFRDVASYEPEIERLLTNPEELMGRTTGSARLDKCLGGLRPGLMVVSGDTGHGKTTWATWLLWEQARAQVPVMVTSFEQRPVGTVQKLLRMQLGADFTQVAQPDRAAALQALGQMPIHMLDHYGQLPAVELMQAVRYAVRRLGVKAVLVDHLGFLLDSDAHDKVSQIEGVIRALAITAYSLRCTIILVCHPKALPPGHERITINDIKGASAIKQDASEVVIVQRDPPRNKASKGQPARPWPAAWIHFDKVRSEFGVPGSRAQLAFGPLSCRYADEWDDTPEGSAGLLLVDPT